MSDMKDSSQTENLDNKNKNTSIDQSRRKFTKAGAATPIIMTLASQPVWGIGPCSISGFMSGNLSEPQRIYDCTGGFGCTPGFWKNHPGVWKDLTGVSPGHCKQVKVKGALTDCTVWDPNTGFCLSPAAKCEIWDGSTAAGATTFSSIFGYTSAYGDTLMEVLQSQAPGNNAQGSLDWHACAAVLNALADPIEYGATGAEVVAAYQKAMMEGQGQHGALHDIFADLNERGCPIDSFGRCESHFTLNDNDVCIPVE